MWNHSMGGDPVRAVSGRGDLSVRMQWALAELDEWVRDPLLRWRPQNWSKADLAALEAVLSDAQGWVAMAGLQNTGRACQWLRFVPALVVFIHRNLGERSVEVVSDSGYAGNDARILIGLSPSQRRTMRVSLAGADYLNERISL